MHSEYPLHGTIPIQMTFTVAEWEAILNELYHLYVIADFGESKEDKIIMNIIDRIEKNLGLND